MKTNLKRTGLLSAAVVLLLISVVGTVMAAGEIIARYSAGATSGGGSINNGQVSLRSAFGQPVAGVTANSANMLCSGFACGMGAKADEAISGLTASNTSPTELGNPTGFSASVTTGANVLYAWDFGDGNLGAGPSPTHVYGAAGTYVATVAASNGAGSATAATTVTVTGAGTTHAVSVFNFGFNPDPVTIQVGDTVTWVREEGFHNVVADDGSFNSGPPSSSWTEYSHTFTSAGEFPYYCEAHGGPGGTGMSSVVIVQAGGDEPITGLTSANDGPTTLGQPTGFLADRTGGTNVSYSWDFGDGNGAAGAAVRHTYAAPGEYTATVTASNSAGSVQAQTVVQIADAVVDVTDFAFSPDPVTIPAGGTVIWVRREGFHNVVADDGSFNSGPPSSAWTTYSHTFATPGVFPYYCEPHGGPGGEGMAGTINVFDTSALERKVWLPVVRTAPQ